MQVPNKSDKRLPKIVVVGGGAGGLELAASLGRRLGKKKIARVVLIDKERTHIWKPLLHEVATGSFDTEIEGVVYQVHGTKNNYEFQLGVASQLDKEKKFVKLEAIYDDQGELLVGPRKIDYDILVLAVGSVSNDFGVPGVKEHCHTLDSKQRAFSFQKSLLNQLLKTHHYGLDSGYCGSTRVAIVGAGPTGVELSAELFHMRDRASAYNFSSNQKIDVSLIESAGRILSSLPERISESALKELKATGVKVFTSTRIEAANESGLIDANGNLIEADIMGDNWLKSTGLECNQNNQLICESSLNSVSDKSIYVIGDCANIIMSNGEQVPPRAQSAHQMAKAVVKNITLQLRGKPHKDFKYVDYGSLVSLSRITATGSLMGNLMSRSMFIEGKLARLMYLSLYRMHQLAIHGYVNGPVIILLSSLSKIIRPRIKLH